jgi:hypothetical protein
MQLESEGSGCLPGSKYQRGGQRGSQGCLQELRLLLMRGLTRVDSSILGGCWLWSATHLALGAEVKSESSSAMCTEVPSSRSLGLKTLMSRSFSARDGRWKTYRCVPTVTSPELSALTWLSKSTMEVEETSLHRSSTTGGGPPEELEPRRLKITLWIKEEVARKERGIGESEGLEHEGTL